MQTNLDHPPHARRALAARSPLFLIATIAAMAASGCAHEGPCSIRDNGDGTQTIACGGTEAVVGGGCTATENADGTQTIACANGSEFTIPAGVLCGLTDQGDGTLSFSCSDGTDWTLAPGCETRVFDFRTHQVVVAECPDGSKIPLTWNWRHDSVAQLGAGYAHTCGLRADGSPHCWGADGAGQSTAPSDEVFVQIAVGGVHACGLRADGSSRCWGLADGATADQPGEVFVQLVTGDQHTCGLRADGSAHCWGSDVYDESSPPSGERFVALAAGWEHTCGLRADGSSRCWGRNSFGQTADQPGEVFVQLTAGNAHTCGLRPDGTALCWGASAADQTADQPGTFAQLTAGSGFTCGIRPDGTSHCWGNPADGRTADQPGEAFVQLAAGSNQTCGLRANATVLCWGADDQGQSSPPWVFRCRPADAPASVTTGLAYEQWAYAMGAALPDFAALAGVPTTGTIANVDIPNPGDNFALRITGYVSVPADGEYTFGLTSDAGSRLRVGDDVIVDNDGLHEATTKTEYLCLDAGRHAITVEYFEYSGPETLSLTMAAGDAELAPIADADLGHAP